MSCRPIRILAPLASLIAVLSCGGADGLAPPTSVITRSSDSTLGTANAPRGQAAREILVNTYFLASGPSAPGTGASLPTSWRSRDPSVATVVPYGGPYIGRVLGVRPGTTVIEGSALGATVTIPVTVLARAPSSAVSPVLVGFRMLEVRYDPASDFWSYAPEIVLRDTTGRGGSAIIKVSFDLPGLGGSPPCNMTRAIGSDPLEVFRESYGDFELTIDGSGGQRASAGEAVAHITLRIPGPAAMTFDVSGPIVPGALPTTYSGQNPDVLSCG